MNVILNMEQFLPDKGGVKKLTAAEMVFLERCERMILAALKCKKGEICSADITCSAMTGDMSCTSGLDIRITDIPGEIMWRCGSCGCTGIIRNWRKSPVCSAASKPAAGSRETATRLTIPSDCMPLLLEVCCGDPELMMLLSMADFADKSCSFHMAAIDRYRLLDSVSARCSNGKNDDYAILRGILEESIKGIPFF